MQVTCKVTGNTQAYGLSALRGFMGYESGLETFLKNSELIDKVLSKNETVAFMLSLTDLAAILFGRHSDGAVQLQERTRASVRFDFLRRLDSGQPLGKVHSQGQRHQAVRQHGAITSGTYATPSIYL